MERRFCFRSPPNYYNGVCSHTRAGCNARMLPECRLALSAGAIAKSSQHRKRVEQTPLLFCTLLRQASANPVACALPDQDFISRTNNRVFLRQMNQKVTRSEARQTRCARRRNRSSAKGDRCTYADKGGSRCAVPARGHWSETLSRLPWVAENPASQPGLIVHGRP